MHLGDCEMTRRIHAALVLAISISCGSIATAQEGLDKKDPVSGKGFISFGYYDVGGWDSGSVYPGYFKQPETAKKAFERLVVVDSRLLALYPAINGEALCAHYKIKCDGLSPDEIRALFSSALEEKRRAEDRNNQLWMLLFGLIGALLLDVFKKAGKLLRWWRVRSSAVTN